MKIFLYAISICFSTIVYAQEFRIHKGQVIDFVAMVNDSLKESYSIYLPKSFDEQKKWPVIYVFDPEKDGKKGVSAFSEGAEKFGYIVVGSNNIDDGSPQLNFRAFQRLSKEISTLFPIDESGVYVAGFSGAARLASSIAILSSKIKGVIACNAGFSSAYQPRKNTFSFVGIVGDTDFNFVELQNTVAFLKRRKFEAELFVFEGEHEWPPKFYLTKAIGSLELKRMTKGEKEKDETFAKTLYEEDYRNVQSLISKQQPTRAIEELDRMRTSYRFYFEVDSLKNKERSIRRTPILRKKISSERQALAEERLRRLDYIDIFSEDIDTIFMDNLGWWESEIKILDELIKGENKEKQKMGKRLKDLLYQLGTETAEGLDAGKYKEKVLYLQIFRTLADPKAYDAYLKIMVLSSRDQNFDMALYYTEELLKNGFKDKDKLYEEQGMSLLRIQPEFIELIRKYL
ncbi:hypothetical protein GWK08_18425 [Leptobacterium flavescens]|uniref:Alpha/beta hydrolase n=1 Tax=Leptobacterium flavescens TaxID=472055 RepID=A0A6P0UYB1_9FLAO|nr:hypothetical protein [Leptobacterium flavescens]NER15436.1 hypothetical protein [Leptobacterium flavescens]